MEGPFVLTQIAKAGGAMAEAQFAMSPSGRMYSVVGIETRYSWVASEISSAPSEVLFDDWAPGLLRGHSSSTSGGRVWLRAS